MNKEMFILYGGPEDGLIVEVEHGEMCLKFSRYVNGRIYYHYYHRRGLKQGTWIRSLFVHTTIKEDGQAPKQWRGK